jgi:hypothetical protein
VGLFWIFLWERLNYRILPHPVAPAGLTSLLLSIPLACASRPSSPNTSISGAYSGRVIMISIMTNGTDMRQKRAFFVPCECPRISALMSNRTLLFGELGDWCFSTLLFGELGDWCFTC